MTPPPTLASLITRAAQAAGGVLPFEAFMDLALYAPGLGFYEQAGRGPGRRADFITSVSVGSLFGELIAWRVGAWLETLPGPVRWIEAGAHDGRLAADVLDALARLRPRLLQRLEYWILEPSPARRAWQMARLAGAPAPVRWLDSPEALAAERPRGALVVNELLDAFPIRRWLWDRSARAWAQWGVAAAGAGFRFARIEPAPPGVGPALPAEILALLPDGFTLDEAPGAAAWWGGAAAALAGGWLVAFDYGLSLAERLHPARHEGCLRAYRKHRLEQDPLADPGELDLTAPVDFEAVAAAGVAAGAATEETATQSAWLGRVVRDALGGALGDAEGGALGLRPGGFSWDASRTRQFQSLTHPDHLGPAFKVLVQRKTGA